MPTFRIGLRKAVRALGAQTVVPAGAHCRLREAVNQAIDETQAYLTISHNTVRAAVLREASMPEAYRDSEAALTPRFGNWAIFKHCLPFNVQRMYDEMSGTRPRISTETQMLRCGKSWYR